MESPELGDSLAEGWLVIWLTRLKSFLYLRGSFEGNSGWIVKFRSLGGKAGIKGFGLLVIEPNLWSGSPPFSFTFLWGSKSDCKTLIGQPIKAQEQKPLGPTFDQLAHLGEGVKAPPSFLWLVSQSYTLLVS